MIYVHLATGFEEVEALTTVDVMRRAGIEAQLVSITGELIVTGSHGIKVVADTTFEDADYDSCDMIVLPGGLPGSTNLEAHEGLKAQIQKFAADGKRLAAICAAPLVLASHGVLEGKCATIYPGMEEYIAKGGAAAIDADTVVDGKVITGKGPALAMEFALEILESITDSKTANEVAAGLLYER